MKVVRGLNKVFGLMFRTSYEPIVFLWKKPVHLAIHSFFCRSFIARWYDEEDNLIEERYVPPNQLYVKPNRPFVKLIETPIAQKEEIKTHKR